MRKFDSTKPRREGCRDGVPFRWVKTRGGGPVLLGMLLPALLKDIKKRIERTGGFTK